MELMRVIEKEGRVMGNPKETEVDPIISRHQVIRTTEMGRPQNRRPQNITRIIRTFTFLQDFYRKSLAFTRRSSDFTFKNQTFFPLFLDFCRC